MNLELKREIENFIIDFENNVDYNDQTALNNYLETALNMLSKVVQDAE